MSSSIPFSPSSCDMVLKLNVLPLEILMFEVLLWEVVEAPFPMLSLPFLLILAYFGVDLIFPVLTSMGHNSPEFLESWVD